MAAADRNETPSVMDELLEHPRAFDFFHALRLLQSTFSEDMPRIGDARRVSDEPFRLRQEPTLDFAPSTIAAAQREDEERLALAVYFWGLHGPNGALPTSMTEFLLERRRRFKDVALLRFLDVFHHRALTLFFRAWALNHQAVDYERREASRFTRHLLSLIGAGTEGMRERDSLGEEAKLFFAGHLVHQTRHAEGLASILSAYFDVPVQVEQFSGQWLALPEESLCVLGQRNAALGQDAIAGRRMWTCQLAVRLRIGPISQADMRRLLPTGEAFVRLRDWMRFYCSYQFDWDVQITLQREEVPPTVLGGSSYLGWTTWTHAGAPAEDRDDLILNGETAA